MLYFLSLNATLSNTVPIFLNSHLNFWTCINVRKKKICNKLIFNYLDSAIGTACLSINFFLNFQKCNICIVMERVVYPEMLKVLK